MNPISIRPRKPLQAIRVTQNSGEDLRAFGDGLCRITSHGDLAVPWGLWEFDNHPWLWLLWDEQATEYHVLTQDEFVKHYEEEKP